MLSLAFSFLLIVYCGKLFGVCTVFIGRHKLRETKEDKTLVSKTCTQNTSLLHIVNGAVIHTRISIDRFAIASSSLLLCRFDCAPCNDCHCSKMHRGPVVHCSDFADFLVS